MHARLNNAVIPTLAGPPRRPLPRLLLAFLGLMGLGTISAGCATDQRVIAQANEIHSELEPSVIDDPQLERYVQAVGHRIVEAGQQLHAEGEIPGEPWMFEDVNFHLVASPTPNAFTTGGKHIYLYSQLFEESQTEDAFAAVVAHEFGHVVGRHVQESMNDQLLAGLAGLGLVGATAVLSDEDDRQQNVTAAGAAAGLGSALGITYFGREKEREADELGFEMYVRAGYDPQKFPQFFENMIAQGQGQAGLAGYLSTHPQLADRVEAAELAAARVPPEVVQRYSRPPLASPEELERLQQQSSQYTQAAAQAEQSGMANRFTRALAILDAFPKCVGVELEQNDAGAARR